MSAGVHPHLRPLIAYILARPFTQFARRVHGDSFYASNAERRCVRPASGENRAVPGLLHARITCRHVGTRVTRVIKIFSLPRHNAPCPSDVRRHFCTSHPLLLLYLPIEPPFFPRVEHECFSANRPARLHSRIARFHCRKLSDSESTSSGRVVAPASDFLLSRFSQPLCILLGETIGDLIASIGFQLSRSLVLRRLE